MPLYPGDPKDNAADLDVPLHSKTRGALDESTNLGATKVLGERSELGHVDIRAHDAIGFHLGSMNVENLQSAVLIGKGDFHVHLKSTRPGEGLVNHVHPIRHSDDENVVKLVDTVHLPSQGQ